MPRRRTVINFRKYMIIFFGLLLVIIYCNHTYNNFSKDYEANLDQTTHLRTVQKVKQDIQRTKRLYALAKQRHIGPYIQRIIFDDSLSSWTYDIPTTENTSSTIPRAEFATQKWFKTKVKTAKYFVNNGKCKMPSADPFSREAIGIYSPSKFKMCTNETDIITLIYNADQQQYKLHINENETVKLMPTIKKIACNYREITESEHDTIDELSILHQRVYFDQDAPLNRSIVGVIVECHDKHNDSNILQQDAFPLVQVHKGTNAEPLLKLQRQREPELQRQPSVILLGLDSMSRMNFQRTMPKTSSFLRRLNFFEMRGYNKVADNTLPNLLVVLTGHTPSQAGEICTVGARNCLDQLPWIWKNFQDAGYKAAVGEDVLGFSLFRLGVKGFMETPCDHYFRTFMLGINNAMKVYNRFGYQYCIGRRLSIGYLYDFCNQFVQRYMKELNQPVFGFFWSCTFTHDYHFGASSLDGKFVEYLSVLEDNRIFEEAIVIFFSDHGVRYGDLMELSDSFLEERLPMLHIYLPPWFRSTYPEMAEALVLNRDRLSSNFDLYNTLRHILQLNATTPAKLPMLKNCPSSHSLLHLLPEERGCEDACIPEHWCTCNPYKKEPKNADVYYVAKVIVFHINRYMLVNKFHKKCQRLRLDEIDLAERKIINEEDGKENVYGKIITFRLRFRTFPPTGWFQTTFTFNRETLKVQDLEVPDISRLNSYKNNSMCVKDKIAKKFCFCYGKKLDTYDLEWIHMNEKRNISTKRLIQNKKI